MSEDPSVPSSAPESHAFVRSYFASEAIVAYVARHVSEPDPVQRALRAETRARTGRAAGMQIGDDQAVLMEVLARSIGARRAIEIGTFTGYSALAMDRGMVNIEDANVRAIRAFNDRVKADDRVQSVLLHIGDGLTLIQKR